MKAHTEVEFKMSYRSIFFWGGVKNRTEFWVTSCDFCVGEISLFLGGLSILGPCCGE